MDAAPSERCGWVRLLRRPASLELLAIPVMCLLVTFLSGCARVESSKPVHIEGQVLLHGRPLVNGMIAFVPNRDKGTSGKTVTRALDLEGRYVITTDSPQPILPGWYFVAIAEPPDLNLIASGYKPFPTQLRRPDLSGIEREIVAGQDAQLDFEIEVGE